MSRALFRVILYSIVAESQNQYLVYLTDPIFQGVNILFLFYDLKIMHIEQVTSDIFLKL